VDFRQTRPIERDLLMRALILSLAVVAAALPALAQNGAPSRGALALGAQAARAAEPRLDQGVNTIVETIAHRFSDGAARAGETIDESALAAVTESEAPAIRPVLWDGMARIYAETYSQGELKALLAYYRDHPGDPRDLPAALAAKSDGLQARQRDLIGQIGPRILQDFFGDYCSRAPCTDATRLTAGLPPRGN
jgi:hypothetical protein